MVDSYGFVTQETDYDDWVALRSQWESEHRPGYVVKGNKHYTVFIKDDVIKFRLAENKDLYNSTSMG